MKKIIGGNVDELEEEFARGDSEAYQLSRILIAQVLDFRKGNSHMMRPEVSVKYESLIADLYGMLSISKRFLGMEY